MSHSNCKGKAETWLWSDFKNESFFEPLLSEFKRFNSFNYISLPIWDTLGDLLTELSKIDFSCPIEIYLLSPSFFYSKYYEADCIVRLYDGMRNKGLKILITKHTDEKEKLK